MNLTLPKEPWTPEFTDALIFSLGYLVYVALGIAYAVDLWFSSRRGGRK